MKNTKIISHDFGYGKQEKINKLNIKNINDLKDYISQLISDNFENVSENTIEINGEKIKILIN